MKFNLFANKIKPKKERKSAFIAPSDTLIDTILKVDLAPNLISNADINLILKDITFSQCDISRKAFVAKQDLQVICDDEAIKENLQTIFSYDTISQILETYLYGLNVFEINYKEIDGLFYPQLIQRDFRDFVFFNGELKFKRNGVKTDIPPYKCIYALNRANFFKPYGDSAISKLYWIVKMKNASLKFWIKFLEKFGSPWAIAKTDFDANELAREVYAMLNGDVAVIDESEEISLTQPNSDTRFENLIEYCDNQISKLILGANLTSNVTSGSLAAAKVHGDIRKDIALGDMANLEFVLNRAVKFFKEINSLEIDIKVKFFDTTEPNLELAKRDATLYSMGFRPTQEYIKQTYNYDIDENANNTEIFANKFALKNNASKPLDAVEKTLNEQEFDEALKPALNDLKCVVANTILSSATYEEAYEKLSEIYADNMDELEAIFVDFIANSRINGAL